MALLSSVKPSCPVAYLVHGGLIVLALGLGLLSLGLGNVQAAVEGLDFGHLLGQLSAHLMDEAIRGDQKCIIRGAKGKNTAFCNGFLRSAEGTTLSE